MKMLGTLTIDMVRNLANDDGFTIKNGSVIRYASGYQVATHGIVTTTADEAYNALLKLSEDDPRVGIWYEKGLYYIDHSVRVDTKKLALAIGRACKQISIYDWKRDTCHECFKRKRK